MLKRLVKLYTPFICAIMAIIHGVLYLCKYSGCFYWIASNFTGHSILLIMYVMVHSKRMCKWYKITLWMLMLVHVSNTLFYTDIIPRRSIIYVTLILNMLALMFWLIFMATRRITKAIHSACKR